MGRRNHVNRTDRRNVAAHYDSDVTFRPDIPNVRFIVDHMRKTVFRNVDARPDAVEIQYIGYGNKTHISGGW